MSSSCSTTADPVPAVVGVSFATCVEEYIKRVLELAARDSHSPAFFIIDDILAFSDIVPTIRRIRNLIEDHFEV